MFGNAFARADLLAKLSAYPDPPTDLRNLSPYVTALIEQHLRVREGRAELPAAAYFWLTVLEAPFQKSKRKRAARKYNIDFKVLDKLGELSSFSGGSDARKVQGLDRPLTESEGRWLREVMAKIIHRVWDVDEGVTNLPPLTISDLPIL